MKKICWKRDPDGRYQTEHATIVRRGGGFEVYLDPYLVKDRHQFHHVADTLAAAKKVAEGRIRAWLDCGASLSEIDRRLTHYEQILLRLEPIDYGRCSCP